MTEEQFEGWPLPKGWACARFEDVADIAQNLVAPSKVLDLPHIAPNHIASGNRQLLPYSTVRADAVISSKQRFYPGQILFTKIRPYLLKSVLVDFEGVCSADMYPLWTKDTAEPKYLLYWLTSPEFQNVIAHEQGRTVLPKINQAALNRTPMALPPLPEQRRIVAKIDSLSVKSKRARDQLDHIPRLVGKYKQAILAAAFRGVLTQEWRGRQPGIERADELIKRTKEPSQSRGGREATTDIKAGVAGLSVNDPGTEAPRGWMWVSLRRVARQETGHTPSRSHPEYWDGGIPWIGIRDAGNHHGQIIHDTFQTVSEKGLANSSARLLPSGTVCLSRTASVGYVTIMGRPMATSQDFATWTCSPALVPKYLMFALMAEGDNIRNFGEGSTHTTIYFPEIRALHICLAPLLEQHQIVRRIEKAFTWIDRLAFEANSARKLIDHLDQSVLSKAFRGELVPQDPNDEPASVLLERIKAERATVPSKAARTVLQSGRRK